MYIMQKVRTRFCPSPTGYMHVGGVRTALFAWLVARQNNGDFILRIEDTDKNREVTGSEKHILQSLKWLGLEWDEGPDIGGPFGPYKQSERLDYYKKWADKLIESGRAYADPYTPEQTQEFRLDAQKAKKPFLFRNHRPDLQASETQKWDGTKPLRFRSKPKTYSWHDDIMGDLRAGPEVIDDFILIKSDGYPTYNFAHIVDDAEMKISHIIRGQEFISSTANYLNLYEALGLTPPTMATVPHILQPEGSKKLGKRDGAKDILDYATQGYLPQAMISFLATLGWNDGTEQEVFNKDELIAKFSLDRVQRSGARFDEKRLLWTNGHFIREMPLDKLSDKVTDFWPKSADKYDKTYKEQVLGAVQERLKHFSELPELTEFFFKKPKFDISLVENDKKLNKVDTKELAALLNTSIKTLEKCDFNPDNLREHLDGLLAQTGQKPAILLGIIRLALTRVASSPNLAQTLQVLGKDESISRLKEVMLKLEKP